MKPYHMPEQKPIVVRHPGNTPGRLLVLVAFAVLLLWLLPSKTLFKPAEPTADFQIRNIRVDFDDVSASAVTWRISGQLHNQADTAFSAPDVQITLQDGSGNNVNSTQVRLNAATLAAGENLDFSGKLTTRPGITLKPVVTIVEGEP